MDSVSRSLLVVLVVVAVERSCAAMRARPAGPGDVPYSVVVRSGGVCSGALMSPRYVVTAAHCLDRYMDKNTSLPAVTVIAGSLSSDKLEQGRNSSQTLLSESVFFYPSYSMKWAEHDIAIIKLQDAFNLSVDVGLIPLTTEQWGNTTRQCEVSGYGRLQKDVNSTLDHRLKTHTLNITKPCPCESQLIVEKGNRVQNWLCSELGSYSGPCKGDSGAPLVCDGRLWGLTSSTFYIYHPQTCNMSREPQLSRCGSIHELNIFMDIYPYLTWIQEIITSTSSSCVLFSYSPLISLCIPYIVYNSL